jgi:hypothetical protein
MDVKNMTLAEFLLARIAEDEATARDAPDKDHGYIDSKPYKAFLAFDVCNEPTGEVALGRIRMLAECEAKRRIVIDFQHYQPHDPEYDGLSLYVALLALPYADHEDFREEWRV